MKPTIVATVLVAGLAGAGCVAEDASSEEATGEAQQPVSSLGIWSWGCSQNCSLALGPVNGQTCFLAGVWGNLQPAGSFSEVFVVPSGGQWLLQIATDGRPLGGTAVCIPGTASTVMTWNSGAAETSLGWGPTRRCFLSGVRNVGGAFTASSDFVQVHQGRGGQWLLGGNIASGATALGVCVDVPNAANDFGLVVPDGQSLLKVVLQDHSPTWACGIKKLGGHFTTSDYNDGIWIEYGGGMWVVNVVNGKQVTTDCVN
jgi:hypothetical protein